MESGLVLSHERVDDLQRNGLRIIQNPSSFCFGMDAVLLADFTTIRPKDKTADLGTGTGILPVLLSQKQATAKFHAFEVQRDMADMADRTVRLNGLEHSITVHGADMRDAAALIGHGAMDVVVCNPPYGKRGGAVLSKLSGLRIACHETEIGLAEVSAVSAALLRNHGRLSMAFPAARLLELCDGLRANRLEPKRIRMVCAKRDRPPYLVLLEAMKNAGPSLHWLPPLVVYHRDGRETEELRAIYHK
ncbi:MAG: tRNA1(Val) (adenine(37)-N6)-methyltransferase [Clostridia bacterium]|nr:tRNA1(Val) (adenine(37)-N6)-methyltransferase [Clostridia bacterium]